MKACYQRAALAALLLLTIPACSLSTSRGVQVDTGKAAEIHITVCGDTMMDASARSTMDEQGYDYAFSGSRSLYAGSDLVLVNLEGPLTSRGEKADKKYTFRSPPEKVAKALKTAGISAVTLANNHSLDYGEEGLTDTIQALDEAGIGYFGAGKNLIAARKPLIMKLKGIRIGMLGYSMTYPEEFWASTDGAGTAFGHKKAIIDDVTALKKKVDIVLVSFHWGQEGKTKLRFYQRELAHAAIDAGADAVIGHHPHIAQAIEKYKDKAIIYSLGNYVFGSYSNRVQYGLIGEFKAGKKGISELKLLPVDVNNFRVQFRPAPLKGKALESALKQMETLSAGLDAELKRDDGILHLKLK